MKRSEAAEERHLSSAEPSYGGRPEDSWLRLSPAVALETSAQSQVEIHVALGGPDPYVLTGPHRCVGTGVDLKRCLKPVSHLLFFRWGSHVVHK